MESIYEKYNWSREEMAANCLSTQMLEGNIFRLVDELWLKIEQGCQLYCFGTGKMGSKFGKILLENEINLENITFVNSQESKEGNYFTIGKDKSLNIIGKKRMLEQMKKADCILFTMVIRTAYDIAKELIEVYNIDKDRIFFIDYMSNATCIKTIDDLTIYAGECILCGGEVRFLNKGEVPRYDCVCMSCGSVPRHRAIIHGISRYVPEWGGLAIHESSPSEGSSDYLRKYAKNYSFSHYFQGHESGEMVPFLGEEIMCQNIEKMSFAEESFDLFITQDVLEHIFSPEKAFKEIGRVLKKGGTHIFTLPWYSEYTKTRCRAKLDDSHSQSVQIKHLEKPMYHGNPIDQEGSLVTYDWGQDLIDIIYQASGMHTTVYLYENKRYGLEGEFLEVFISRK